MEKIKVTMDGKVYEVDKFSAITEFVHAHMQENKQKYVLAFCNRKLCELGKLLDRDVELKLVEKTSVIGMDTYKRSLTFLMVKAFSDVMGSGYSVKVMYSLGKGYYCRLLKNFREGDRMVSEEVPVTKDILFRVKNRMNELVRKDIAIIKESVSTEEAVQRFAKQGRFDKERLFRYRRVSKANLYSIEDYEDYFYGYMASNTAYIRYFDLYLYDDGFVLQMPEPSAPEKVDAFEPPEKLFNVLKQSTRWGELLGVRTVADINNALADGSFSELMLVQEALQEKKIAEIAENIIESGKRIILIAGPSSSGKTTFSHRLSIQLRAHGLRPHPIPVDNYFVNREDTPLDAYGKPNFECLEALDIKELNKDLQGLLAGEEVELPIFNFVSGKREMSGEKLQIGDRDVLVIEGIHSLNDAMTYSIDKENKFKIYISALTQLNIDEHNRIPTTDARLLRRIVRDAAKRGTNAAKTISMWQSVRRGEDENIFPYQENCDVMFNSVLIYELAILKQYAEPLLFSVREDQPEYETAKYLIKFLGYFLGSSSENVPQNSILREFIGGSCFNVG